MAKLEDKMRVWWESRQPRERGLLLVLGITGIVFVIGFGGIMISSGLDAIEVRNATKRKALQQLHAHRLATAKGTAVKAKQVTIPAEAQKVDLESYLGKITSEVGISYPKFNRSEQPRAGEVVETTGRIEFRDISLQDLKRVLEKIEANPIVAVREMRVRRDLRDQEKIDVPELVVSTFYKKSAIPVAADKKEDKK